MIAYVTLGGVAGTLARYFLQGWVQDRAGAPGFPYGTLAVNLAGSFALGFLVRFGTSSTVFSPEVRAGLTIGLCGSFTTMSTFGYETFTLMGDGQYWRAALYALGTVAGCLLAVAAGTAVANKLL